MADATEIVVQADRLKAYCSAVYQRLGLPQEDAEIGADVLVEAELRGKGIQGVWFLPSYVAQIQNGAINPRPRIQVIAQAPAISLVDGDRGLGQVVSTKAMQMAIDLADQQGTGMVAVRNSNDFSMAGYYAMQAVVRDMIGFCATSGSSVITAFGGLDRVIGQGPIAWAIPAGQERPIVVDMTHAVAPIGKIRVAAREGVKLPKGWAVNSDGEPILDPSEALKNVILVPIGGYKGYSLITIMEVLTGILTGALINQSPTFRNGPTRSGGDGHIFLALKVSAIMPLAEFKAGTDRLIRQIKISKRAKGVSRVYVPGERSYECREQRMKHGIPLIHTTYQAVQELGRRLGVEAPLP
jgi:LDH2 family malate/lactate/ureidoglycolate dehydrogenase